MRTVADLPWQGRAVRRKLHARRFFCDHAACAQRIFCERLPAVVAPYARHTLRLISALEVVGVAVGGEGGAPVACRLGMRTSPDTVRRRLRRAVVPAPPPPRVLGIDDWAKKKGQRYGTLLSDLEHHRPIDLLPDREAATVAQWLKAHPGVAVISRDRAGAYAEGARQGAPRAQQVADRWHVLKNLVEACERFLCRHHQALRQAAAAVTAHLRAAAPARQEEAARASTPQGSRSTVSRERRYAQYKEIRRLSQQGWSRRALARQFGLHRRTIRQFVAAQSFPEPAPRQPRGSCLDPFIPYLQQRWAAGCHNAAALWRDIRGQGFRGTAALVRSLVRHWRPGSPGVYRRFAPPSPRTATWWLLHELVHTPGECTAEQREFLPQLCTLCPEVSCLQALVLEFAQLLRHRRGEALESWLVAAQGSEVPELVSFVVGVQRDQEAVQAACTSVWSNGQVAGQVNRLKLLKRQRFGRANFDLLKVRVLPAA